MPIESDLYAALVANSVVQSMCRGRVRPYQLDQGTDYPAISYALIAVTREARTSYTLDHGYNGYAVAHFQIDVWTRAYSDAVSLASAVLSVVHGLTFQGNPAGARTINQRDSAETFEGSFNLFRKILDAYIPYFEG